MKKVLIISLAFLPLISGAQIGGLLNKVKNKVTQRIDQKVDKNIDKSLDQIEGVNSKGTGPADAGNGSEEPSSIKPVQSYSKFDFIPGDKILYYENFEQDAIGELPAAWNTNGSGEVVTLESFPGKWLRVHNPFIYLSSNTKEFTQNYTAEFDLVLQLKNNGWMYPTFTSGFFASKAESSTDNVFLKSYDKNSCVTATLYPEQNNNSRGLVESITEGKSFFKSEAKVYADLQKYYGQVLHVSMQVQKQRFRMWVNDYKLFDVPRAVDTSFQMNQVFFKVGQTNYKEDQYGVYLSNIKLATGLPDTRHKLIEEGRFSTTGILFDLNSATVQPASYAVVKEIATVLKENPAVRIRIIGHTSSDGDYKANLELSVKRAASVKELLAGEFGIEAVRIDTAGKGETQPVADNKTREGKVQNRRVEFIKL